MISNWKQEFAPHIAARGEKYQEEGRINWIQRDNNAIVAEVAGSFYYDVEIVLGENRIQEMSCSCPYAKSGENCKHMAAVLFALEKDDVIIEKFPHVRLPQIVSHIPVDIPWIDAIDHLPEDIIRRELMKLVDRNDCMKERLSVLYLGKLPDGQLQNWKADLQEIAGEFVNGIGYIDSDDVWTFAEDLQNFLDSKLPLLLEVGATMDVFHLVWNVLETALEWKSTEDNGQLFDLFEECEDTLNELISDSTELQKKQMQQWYLDHRNEEWPGGVEHMDDIFQKLHLDCNLP